MGDQAEQLRRHLKKAQENPKAKTVSIVSGKGGVGKSNVAINFALSLIELGKSVVIFDLDIGMGNIDILIGRQSSHSISDLFDNSGESIHSIIEKGPNNLDYIAGGSGLHDLFTMDDLKREHFFKEYQSLLYMYDYILFDMGAGATRESLSFVMASDECLVVATPEPTALTDAYGMMKQIINNSAKMPIKIVMNRSQSVKIGYRALEGLKDVIKQFLNKDVLLLGTLPDDKTVSNAVMRQTPYIIYKENAPVSKAMKEIATKYIAETNNESDNFARRKSTFLQRLKEFMVEG